LCLGTGILALPFATARAGLLFSPLIIGIVALLNVFFCFLMVDCKYHCNGFSFPTSISSTYSKIAYAGAGWFAVYLTEFSVLFTLWGVCVAYQITFATLMLDVPLMQLSYSNLIILSAIIVFPVAFVKNLSFLTKFSAAGLVCLICGIIAIISNGFLQYGTGAIYEDVLNKKNSTNHLFLWPENFLNMTSFIGVAIFCFGVCALAFPIEESMENKKDFKLAVSISLLFVWIVYVIIGNVSAMLYIHDDNGIQDNILKNLPKDSLLLTIIKLSMALVSFFFFFNLYMLLATYYYFTYLYLYFFYF
jgi:amino acid permease